MRRRARVDSNQAEIIAALRRAGARIFDASGLGCGFPDLVVLWRRQVLLFEVKDGGKRPSARKLTPAEQEFHAEWAGAPLYTVSSIDEAVDVLNRVE